MDVSLINEGIRHFVSLFVLVPEREMLKFFLLLLAHTVRISSSKIILTTNFTWAILYAVKLSAQYIDMAFSHDIWQFKRKNTT